MQSHLREGVAMLPCRRRGRDRAASAACALALLLLLAASPALGGRGGKRAQTDPLAEKPAAAWIADLEAPAQGTRTRASIVLSKLDPLPPEVVPGVAAFLTHADWQVRSQALMVLGNLGPAATDALPAILSLLDDEHKLVRRKAAGILPRIPARSLAMRRAVVAALLDDDYYVRNQARSALVALGPDAADVAPDLARLAGHEHDKVRYAAFQVLEKLDVDAALPVLIPLLTHDQSNVRQGAAQAVGRFGASAGAAVPTLIRMLGDHQTRSPAVHTLARLGPAAAPALPRLMAFLDDRATNHELRTRVAQAVGAIGPQARSALPKLRLELSRANFSEATGRYRSALVLAIVAIAGADDPAVASYATRLAHAQSSSNPMTRVESARALVELGPAAAPAVAALRRSLRRDREPKIRGLAADALAGIGAAARPALPDLHKARSDSNERVRKKAAAAIAAIERSPQTAPPPLPAAAKLAPEPVAPAEPIAQNLADFFGGGSRATRAAVRLAERAPESLPALHAALLAADTGDRERSEMIALLHEIGDRNSVRVLLELARTHPEQPWLSVDVLRALGELPPSPSASLFALEILEGPNATPRLRRQALASLARQRDPSGRVWANRYRKDADVELRASALFLAAALGDRSALEPVTNLLEQQPRSSIRYGLLLALAELADPAEFEKRAAPARFDKRMYASALRIARLRSGDARERSALFHEMLNSRYPIERRIAMRDLLGRDALDELAPLLENWWQVSPAVRITVAGELHRAGHRLVERDRRVQIERAEG
jgi:HEAT repeat protein